MHVTGISVQLLHNPQIVQSFLSDQEQWKSLCHIRFSHEAWRRKSDVASLWLRRLGIIINSFIIHSLCSYRKKRRYIIATLYIILIILNFKKRSQYFYYDRFIHWNIGGWSFHISYRISAWRELPVLSSTFLCLY